MGKPKKRSLKPVNRGFATTSVAKKVIPAEEPPADAPGGASEIASDPPAPSEQQQAPSMSGAVAANGTGAPGAAGDGAAAGDFDEAAVEEHQLQALVDNLWPKIQKDVERTVKAVDFDRRLAKTFPSLKVPAKYRERLHELALESEAAEAPKPTPSIFYEPEEKVLLKVGTTFGVLKRLGFTPERAEECLRAIASIELEDALSWLALHCPEEELWSMAEPVPAESSTPTFVPNATPARTSGSSTPGRRSPELPLTSKPRIPPPSPRAPPTPSAPTADDKARVLARAAAQLTEEDEENPTAAHVRLSIQLSDLQRSTGTVQGRKGKKVGGKAAKAESEEVKALREALKKLEAMYLFDRKEADAMFKAERARLDDIALQERLNKAPIPPKSDGSDAPAASANGTPTPSAPSSAPSTPPAAPAAELPSISVPSTPATTSENGDDSIFGNLLDEMPSTLTAEDGTNITVRDMPLPKHFNARHAPKALLEESVLRVDKYALVQLRIISGESRAAGAAGAVSWGAPGMKGRYADEYEMREIACYDNAQALNYVATVLLHALWSRGHAGSQFKPAQLPPVFRDLWDELEARRKEDEDTRHRAEIQRLRSIVEGRMKAFKPKAGLKAKPAPGVDGVVEEGPTIQQRDEVYYEHLREDFIVRMQSPAYQDMLRQRNTLPIASYRQEILDTLDKSQIIVLSGETGCGKSTQLPAFILEDSLLRGKHCKIYCTEPRRISAISLGQRVSAELGEPPGAVGTNGSLVGYAIRLESQISRTTRLVYATNGIALRMLEAGSGADGKSSGFDELTHIIIDEVHERSIESDFLLIVLKSLLEQRKDLKIVLMSATIESEKLSAYFGGCPILSVPGRTFPVDVRFLEDAVEFSRYYITEDSPYARRRDNKLAAKGKVNLNNWSEDAAVAADEEETGEQRTDSALPVAQARTYSAQTIKTLDLLDEYLIPYDLIVRTLEQLCSDPGYQAYSSATLVFMSGLAEIRRLNDMLQEHPMFGSPDFRIYPLHSTIASDQQSAVFDVPPPGIRKIVIATNIAETGITIPDITCVIDTGRHREMRFDEKRQISRLVECFIAKSNAKQRRGRAGRVQEGLCFHLFSRDRFESRMADHPLPEMMRLSLQDLALRIKIMKVKLGLTIEDVLTRALDPPLSVNIQRAVASLVEVKALTPSEEITAMGRLLSRLPVDVHLGKFLLISVLLGCLDSALTIAATLNSKSPFVTPFGLEREADKAKASFNSGNSDFLTIANAFASWRRASSNGQNFVRKFCRQNFLSQQNLQQIEELRVQLFSYLIDSSFVIVSPEEMREINRARFSRSGRGPTRFVNVPADLNRHSEEPAILHAALAAGLFPKVLSVDPTSWQLRTISNNASAAVHPSSPNFGTKWSELGTTFLGYFTLLQSKKLYAHEIAPLDEMALLLLCGELDTKLASDTVSVHNKIRFTADPRAAMGLKYLREGVHGALNGMMKGKGWTPQQRKAFDIGLELLKGAGNAGSGVEAR